MKQQRLGFQKLYQNLDKILFLFFIIFMLTEYAWLPFNSWAAGTLLRQTGYQFLSYNNVVGVLSSHPLVTLALILLFLANLLVAYVQITLLFLGAHNLLTQEKRTLLKFSFSPKNPQNLLSKQNFSSKFYLNLFERDVFLGCCRPDPACMADVIGCCPFDVCLAQNLF